MIISDIKQLREIPVGETVILVLHLKVVKTDIDDEDCCDGCILSGAGCDHCCSYKRPDKEEVKFIKV